MKALEQPVHLVDGLPMPICKIACAYGSQCFKGEAAYGYCAAKDEKYYGLDGPVLSVLKSLFAAILLPLPMLASAMCSKI
jgi:hypothetical protein